MNEESDFEFNETLIERYKVLLHPGDVGLSEKEVVEMLSICLTLGKLSFTPSSGCSAKSVDDKQNKDVGM